MMKIHTTQNLNALGIVNQQNSILSQKKELNYGSAPQRFSEIRENQLYGLAFQGKPSENAAKRLINKAIKATKENLDNIVKDEKKLDPTGGKKGDFLEWTEDNEVMINNIVIALLLTVIARPLTNVVLSKCSGDKNKKDYSYASGHSISSGFLGCLFTLAFIKPFTKGFNFAKDHPEKYLSKLSDKEYTEWFKTRFPQVDVKTLFSFKDGKNIRNPITEILDICGNHISTDVKDVMKVPLPKHGTETASEVLKEMFGTESWEDIVNKKVDLPDKLDNLFLCVEKEGAKEGAEPKYYPLKYIKEDLLKELLPDLDINSIKNATGERVGLKEWKNLKGEAFDIDRNNLFISSWKSTDKSIPLITGETRLDREAKSLLSKSEEVIKDVCYQNNNSDGLGTPITQAMVDADRANEVQNKLGGWFFDITTAVPRAFLTIATIPIILKYVFHLEKPKKTENIQQSVVQDNINTTAQTNQNLQMQTVAFKGKKEEVSWLRDLIAKTYGAWVLSSSKIRKFSEDFSKKDTTNPTKHFQVLGSLITSTTYAVSTIKSKKLEKDNAHTLAINQALGWIAPTVCGYLVDSKIREKNKVKEYELAAKLTKAIDLSKLNPEEKAKAIQRMTKMLKGVRTLATIATFTVIYRYLFPVVVTPIANYIGKVTRKNKDQQNQIQNNANNVQNTEVVKNNTMPLNSNVAQAG